MSMHVQIRINLEAWAPVLASSSIDDTRVCALAAGTRPCLAICHCTDLCWTYAQASER